MFTGIIQGIGTVTSMETRGDKARILLKVGPLARDVEIGDSVAVSGICLTAVEIGKDWLAFDAVKTTLERTALRRLTTGGIVNLELALRAGDRFGGHFVSGHVDGVGTILSVDTKPGEVRVKIEAPPQVMRYLVERGSVSLSGISLTVASLGKDHFEVAVIPHTWSSTTLKSAKRGDPVNLEGDMIGRWVEKYMGRFQAPSGGLTAEKLLEEGFYSDRPSSPWDPIE